MLSLSYVSRVMGHFVVGFAFGQPREDVSAANFHADNLVVLLSLFFR